MVCLAALALSACASQSAHPNAPATDAPAPAVPSVSGAIEGPEAFLVRSARLEQNAAIAARDLERVASFWAEDVVITAGLGRVLRGKAAYLQAFESDSSIVYERNPQRIETSETWPLAYEQGRWTGRRAADPAAGAALISGSYTAQWVKRSGQWLIRSEVFVALECAAEACRWPAVP